MTSYRIRARVLLLLLIGGLLAATLVVSPALAMAQDPTKPDVHFSFIIEKDGSNTTSVEVAVHPLFDPLIKKGIEFVKNNLTKNEEKKDATYKITTTVRDGRDYQSLVIHYDNLGDLNALMNTPQMLSGLFQFVPNAEIPSIFSQFLVASQETDKGVTYSFHARVEPEVTQALSFANVTFHVRLPGRSVSHNADKEDPKAKELIWVMQPGNPLEISASSIIERGISGVIQSGSGVLPTILKWGGGLLLAVLLLVIIVWLISALRRSHSDEDDDFDDYDDDW